MIRQGDLILMDMAAVVNSYGSDISRTVVVGKATPQQEDFAKMMLGVFDATLAYIRPGIFAWEVDEFVREPFQNSVTARNTRRTSSGTGSDSISTKTPFSSRRARSRSGRGWCLPLNPPYPIPHSVRCG